MYVVKNFATISIKSRRSNKKKKEKPYILCITIYTIYYSSIFIYIYILTPYIIKNIRLVMDSTYSRVTITLLYFKMTIFKY